MYKVDNAIIMAAGTSSRFAPLSYEIPKALIEVNSEVLIERQIRQLKEAGIEQIIIVTGYKKECFEYLKDKYNVILVYNNSYLTRNNNGSIYAARKYIKNSYICSSDNYFIINPFEKYVDKAYYSSIYMDGKTNEWCIKYDNNGLIKEVKVGGENSYVMLGHVFFDEVFSKKFIEILEKEYDKKETLNKLWEDIYLDHINELNMYIRKYDSSYIFEFDTLDELREFDQSYITNTRSKIIKDICIKLNTKEEYITSLNTFKDKDNSASGFTFINKGKSYKYYYVDSNLEEIK